MRYNQRPVMVEIYANRRLRLHQLIKDRSDWNQSAFAKALGFSRTSINEYASGAETIGDRAATRIERALGLPDGWMDSKPPAGAVLQPPYKGRRGQPPKVHALAVEHLLAAGYTQKEAARQIGVHESTISLLLKRERERPLKKERRHTPRPAA